MQQCRKMQRARGSIGASFIPKIRKTRKMAQAVILGKEQRRSVPKACTGNRPTSTLDFNKDKRQRELKGLECLNLNTSVYGH